MTLALSKRKENGMTELPKTEAELQALLDANTKEVTDNLTAKHNSDMANMRKKHDDEIAKVKNQANMTAEQVAEQKYKEQQEKDANELTELRAYKKQTVLGERLAKEGLPSYLKNDVRLLNAEDGDLDRVIKDVKKDYEANLPKGATHSTVVQNAQGNKQVSAKEEAYKEFGDTLKEIVGN